MNAFSNHVGVLHNVTPFVPLQQTAVLSDGVVFCVLTQFTITGRGGFIYPPKRVASALGNSPPVEGWQATPDGVVFCVLTQFTITGRGGFIYPPKRVASALGNSPPVEGWQATPDGVVFCILAQFTITGRGGFIYPLKTRCPCTINPFIHFVYGNHDLVARGSSICEKRQLTFPNVGQRYIIHKNHLM